MKKIFLIFVLSTLFQNTLSANALEYKMKLFAKWLNLNGYDQYLDKTGEPVGYELDRSVCKSTKVAAEYTIIKKCVGADARAQQLVQLRNEHQQQLVRVAKIVLRRT